jgi:hypothetical protein
LGLQETALNPNIRANEIVATFQRYQASNDRSEIDAISVSELRMTDEQLGQRDVGAGFRIAILNRIRELDEEARRKHESKIRAWNLVVGIAVGLLVAGLAKLVFGA